MADVHDQEEDGALLRELEIKVDCDRAAVLAQHLRPGKEGEGLHVERLALFRLVLRVRMAMTSSLVRLPSPSRSNLEKASSS